MRNTVATGLDTARHIADGYPADDTRAFLQRRVYRTAGQGAFVGGALVGAFNQLPHVIGHRLAHQVSVDFFVAATVSRFVQLARGQLLQIRGGCLVHQMPWRTEGLSQQPHLSLGQA